MRRFIVLAAAAATLVFASVAAAATPTQIYRDYADNGRLDAQYSRADLDRALKDAVLQGYGNPSVQTGLGTAAGTAGASQQSGSLPFTGTDLALMVLGGGGLVLVGFGLRRLGRVRA